MSLSVLTVIFANVVVLAACVLVWWFFYWLTGDEGKGYLLTLLFIVALNILTGYLTVF